MSVLGGRRGRERWPTDLDGLVKVDGYHTPGGSARGWVARTGERVPYLAGLAGPILSTFDVVLSSEIALLRPSPKLPPPLKGGG